MEIRSTAKYVHVSPRKLRLIIETIKDRPVREALNALQFYPSPSARLVAKAVKSAAANAENNYQLEPSLLRIVSAVADEGPMFKRFRARSHGRVSPLLRRMSHITIGVAEDESLAPRPQRAGAARAGRR